MLCNIVRLPIDHVIMIFEKYVKLSSKTKTKLNKSLRKHKRYLKKHNSHACLMIIAVINID